MRIPPYSLALTALFATGTLLGVTDAPAVRPAAVPVAPVASLTATASRVPGPTPARADAPAAPALAIAPAALSGTDPDAAPYYAQGQFTARLDQTSNTWQLQPIDGPDRVIEAGTCSTGATAAVGVWLLVVDDDGRAVLVAPSTTALVEGESDRIALRACDKASGHELAVPQDVLDLLTTQTGAIYVDR